jgi:translation elongation factor EF-Tu-like GTPase
LTPEPDIEAEVTYLSTENGGRQGSISSGYRGQFHYEGHDWDAPQYFVGKDRVEPGESVTVRLYFLSPQAHVGRLEVGTMFLVREGLKTVGYGKVTRLLNLVRHAEEVTRKQREA